MKSILKQLQSIRYQLQDIQNCEDAEEMIHISLELASDIEELEEELKEII